MAKQHFVQFFLCFFPTISTLHLDLIQFNQSIQHSHNENILFLYIKQFKQFIYISLHYITLETLIAKYLDSAWFMTKIKPQCISHITMTIYLKENLFT